jgi:hypothetical protein
MKLLELHPEVSPEAPPEPPEGAPRDEEQADPGARSCTHCGATLEPGQDWCLACGTASGPLSERPGRRSIAAMLGLTLLLVTGAVAASYAALRSDPAAPPASTNAQVAQTPPATTPPPAATTAPPETTPTTPGKTSTGKSSTGTLPKIPVPSNKPATPAPTPAPATPAPSTPSASTPPAQPTPPASGGGQPTTPSSTTPAPTAPVAIDLDASAASVYDPYRRAQSVGVPAKAIDGDGGTSWYVDTTPGANVAVGYVLNLGQARGVKSIDITTPTPGFKVEVYATDEATPPPAITDTRWAHITDKSKVGEGGKSHVVLGAGTSKYRTLLLWITAPPADGARVRISELKVFG